MDYAVIRCVNGAFAIHAEFSGDKKADGTPWTDAEKKSAARASFAAYWGALENDKEFKGRVDLKVIDNQLDCVDGIKILVDKTPTPAAETPAAETPAAESEPAE